MGFPYGCICRKNFFDKTETTDTTDTTIWKPGLKLTIRVNQITFHGVMTECSYF